MATDISTVVSVAPAPSSGTQNAHARNTAQTTGDSSEPQQASASEGTAGGNGNASAAGESNFGQLLAKQSSPSQDTHVPANAQDGGAKPSGNTASSGSGTAASPATLSANVLLVKLQDILTAAGTPTPPETQGVSSANGASTADAVSDTPSSDTSSSDTRALNQLQAILQQLLQSVQAGGGKASAVTPASDAAAAGVSSKNGSSGRNDAQPDAALVQALAQINALIQTVSAPTAPGAADTAGNGSAIAGSAGNGSGNAGAPVGALLSGLAKALQAALDANTPAAATAGRNGADTSAENGQNAAGNANGAFETALNTLLQSNHVSSTLQSALSQVGSLLTAAGNGKQGDGDNSNTASLSNAAAGQAAVTPTAANPLPQASDNTGFAKLLPAASAAAPSDQVLVQIRNAVAQGGSQGESQIKIQLTPTDLGKVVVQMTTGADGKTGVTITADNRQTLSMLQSEARSLEASLRDIGLKTGTGGLNFNLSGQQQHTQQQGRQSGYTQVAATAPTEEDADYYSAAVNVYRLSAQQGLDIKV